MCYSGFFQIIFSISVLYLYRSTSTFSVQEQIKNIQQAQQTKNTHALKEKAQK